MAKATIIVPSRSYTPGVRTVTLPNLSSDDHGVNVSLTRESWPDTGSDVLSFTIEGSDDGVVWSGLAVYSIAGGDMVNSRTGLPTLTCGLTVVWPDVTGQGPQRPAQVRAVITNVVTLTTAVTLSGY